MTESTHKVTYDGEERFKGSEGKCWEYILKHQPQSVHYATTWGGWKTSEISTSEKPI